MQHLTIKYICCIASTSGFPKSFGAAFVIQSPVILVSPIIYDQSHERCIVLPGQMTKEIN